MQDRKNDGANKPTIDNSSIDCLQMNYITGPLVVWK